MTTRETSVNLSSHFSLVYHHWFKESKQSTHSKDIDPSAQENSNYKLALLNLYLVAAYNQVLNGRNW